MECAYVQNVEKKDKEVYRAAGQDYTYGIVNLGFTLRESTR